MSASELHLICTKTCNTCKRVEQLLRLREIPYTYREYRTDPLSVEELREVLGLLGVGPRDVLRTHDRAYRELKLTGQEPDDRLLELMSEHPTLLQRPIAILDGKAVIGRPPQNVLDLAGATW